MWDAENSDLPVVPTIASQFADAGVDQLWQKLCNLLNEKYSQTFSASEPRLGTDGLPHRSSPIPPERQGYLAEVSSTIRNYHSRTEEISSKIRLVQQLEAAAEQMKSKKNKTAAEGLKEEADTIRSEIPDDAWGSLDNFKAKAEEYRSGATSYTVRNKNIPVKTTKNTLSGLDLPRVALPDYSDWGDTLQWIRKENMPGSFPYTGGVFPFKRQDELPVRMFAGEGSAERTNKRYHFLSKDQDFNRLSVAFDSPSLYGNDPQERLDIFGKVCESGVSICLLYTSPSPRDS